MFLQEGFHTYFIYILTNKAKSVFYIGVTGNLKKRLQQHGDNILLDTKTFASKYNVEFLLYYEKFTWIHDAIAREKELKGWRRDKKLALIKIMNPNLEFCSINLITLYSKSPICHPDEGSISASNSAIKIKIVVELLAEIPRTSE